MCDEKKFNVLCLSSGGLKGLGQLGALKLLWEKGKLNDIQKYIGTSIGSVLCALLCAGYTPNELIKEISRINIFGEAKSDIYNFFSNYGLIDISPFATNISILLRKKLDVSPSMQQMYELTRKELVIVTVNHTEGRVIYISRKTHPNLNVVNALKMACNVPYLFHKMKYKGCYYVDGALGDPFPFSYFDDGVNNIIGIITDGFKISKSNDDEINDDDDNFFNYFYQTLLIPINEIKRLRMKNSNTDKHLIINLNQLKDTPILELVMSWERKKEIISKGYQEAADKYFVYELENNAEW